MLRIGSDHRKELQRSNVQQSLWIGAPGSFNILLGNFETSWSTNSVRKRGWLLRSFYHFDSKRPDLEPLKPRLMRSMSLHPYFWANPTSSNSKYIQRRNSQPHRRKKKKKRNEGFFHLWPAEVAIPENVCRLLHPGEWIEWRQEDSLQPCHILQFIGIKFENRIRKLASEQTQISTDVCQ